MRGKGPKTWSIGHGIQSMVRWAKESEKTKENLYKGS